MFVATFCGRLGFVATKDVVVRVRVDAATKELWVQSAGGERLLSRWVRERCGAVVSEGDGNPPEGRRVESVGSTPTTAPSPSLTAETCPAAAMSHKPGSTCPLCRTVFPVVAASVERVFGGPDPKPGKR